LVILQMLVQDGHSGQSCGVHFRSAMLEYPLYTSYFSALALTHPEPSHG
jgi:hypothetical protein